VGSPATRDERRHSLEPRTTVGVAIRARGTVQDRAHDFEAAVDRGRACARGEPRVHERFQRLIVDLLWFEVTDVQLEQCDAPLDDVDAAFSA
jgi:hypothetical protein